MRSWPGDGLASDEDCRRHQHANAGIGRGSCRAEQICTAVILGLAAPPTAKSLHDGRRIARYSASRHRAMGPAMLRCFAAVLALLGSLISPAAAQDARRSECLAMSNAPPRAMPASLRTAAADSNEVAITYAGHSTYYIDTPAGVRIATDYSG